jgi:pimeloyl-ACP methyl ester carboxylesterase
VVAVRNICARWGITDTAADGPAAVRNPDRAEATAALFPDARLVEVEDSYTLIAEDQPDLIARLLREFVPAPAVS